ncbi:MAG TPA: hypothetical protein VGB92_14255 [Longimicrobium sp.]|jgi:hypothetical protein
MRPLPNPHKLRGSTDPRRPLPRVRPPSPYRLVLLLVVTLAAIYVLLRRAGAL